MIRSVDQSKCIGCGTCQRICPLDVFRLDVDQPTSSPCRAACPIGINIREINNLLQLGRIEDATSLMFDDNPLAAVTGRVCPKFCESDCSRNQVEAPVNINAIEQYLGDYALKKNIDPPTRRHVAPVAVVGSGPAGLSCAFFLAADGFQVTVYEAMDEPGGMLRYGIPEYRLPNEVLSSVIGRLTKLGVDIRCGQAVEDRSAIDALLDRGYGAVFLGLGAAKSKKIQVEGVDSDDVMYGLDFLKAVRGKQISHIGSSVVVVGGGNVAMDAAQSSLRLGAESVTIVALEEDTRLPAFSHNIDSAKADGVDLVCSSGVSNIVYDENASKTLKLKKCVDLFDNEGKFSPTFQENNTREICADTVILAVGQEADCSYLPEEIVGSGGFITVDKNCYQTTMPKVFAAGDVVTGPASVAEAVYGGKRAAQAINLFCRGIEMHGLPSKDLPVAEKLPEDKQLQKTIRYEKQLAEPPGSTGFAELYRGFDLVKTLAEADRCLVCGAKSVAEFLDDCMTCFTCELKCPTEAIFVHPYKEILPRSLRST